MNIPHKYLINDYISETKLKFYEKLPNRYNKVITEYFKKKSNNNDSFQNKVINWLFNQDEENKMILCSVENKKYTNTIYDAYHYYIIKENDKFKTTEDSSDNDKFKLEYRINYNGVFNKNNKRENKDLNVHDRFLNYLLFYQCETPKNDYENYNNYFTLDPKFLQDEQKFKDECNELTNNQFLSNPIKLYKDPKNKNNYIFQLPEWTTDYYTLSQFILSLIEQALSVRYILYNEYKNIEEIITGTYLYDLFDKKKLILSFINNTDIDINMYYNNFIEEIHTNIFLTEAESFAGFIENKKGDIIKSDNSNYNIYDYVNDENDSIYRDIENVIQNMIEKNNNDKSKFNKELINMCMFTNINKLFTLDGFFLRAIFENFYTEYLHQIENDLIVKEEEKPKKKKKKKKKNNNIINENNVNKDNAKNINDKEEILNLDKKIEIDNFEEINNNKDENNSNMNNCDDKKEKNNKKQKEFFLYEPMPTKKKEKKKNNKNNNHMNDKKRKNLLKSEKENNEMKEEINSTTNAFLTFIELYPNINISNDKLTKLNDDINDFNREMEVFLVIYRKIKMEIKNHFEIIIKDVYNNNSELEIYGSSLYQLDIESSDLDLSISTQSELQLDALFTYISKSNHNNQYLNINHINTASIPVIKLKLDYLKLNNDTINEQYKSLINNNYYKKCIDNNIYKEFNLIKVDISLKSINYNQINFIKKEINEYPEIKPLIKILKKLLILKNMNNSYKGGMSSYCLFLIIFSYLKINQNNKFGNYYCCLLLGFLYHYINYIDFSYTIINPSLDNPFIISNYPIETIHTIIDPATMKNAGKIIFRIIDVINALKDIYNDIISTINEGQNDGNAIYQLFKKYINNQ